VSAARPAGTLGALAARWSVVALYRVCCFGLGASLVLWLLGAGRFDHLVGLALLIGAAQGGGAALLPSITAQLYGTRALGRVLGMLHTGGGVGCLLTLPLAGAVIDLTEGYSAAIALSAAVVFGSWALLGHPGLGGDPTDARPRPRAITATERPRASRYVA
jgi:Major Facilitator Superfamily